MEHGRKWIQYCRCCPHHGPYPSTCPAASFMALWCWISALCCWRPAPDWHICSPLTRYEEGHCSLTLHHLEQQPVLMFPITSNPLQSGSQFSCFSIPALPQHLAVNLLLPSILTKVLSKVTEAPLSHPPHQMQQPSRTLKLPGLQAPASWKSSLPSSGLHWAPLTSLCSECAL